MMPTTLTDREMFLAAILAAPDDDAPRLQFSDWLVEQAGEVECEQCAGQGDWNRHYKTNPYCGSCHGTGRVSNSNAEYGEFIRVQCELSAMNQRHHHECTSTIKRGIESRELRRRERELLEAHRNEWLKDTPGKMDAWSLDEPMPDYAYGIRCQFTRGFVSRVRCTERDWIAHGKKIVRQQPIEWVETDKRPYQVFPDFQYWWTPVENRGIDHDGSKIDWRIFDLINSEEGTLSCLRFKDFKSEAAAVAALSAACIAWAKGS